MCFSNQNTLTNIGKSHNIAFYIGHYVEMVKASEGGVSIQREALGNHWSVMLVKK